MSVLNLTLSSPLSKTELAFVNKIWNSKKIPRTFTLLGHTYTVTLMTVKDDKDHPPTGSELNKYSTVWIEAEYGTF